MWRNWSGNQVATPGRVERPRDETELVRAVEVACARGEPVKCVGAGHSFSGIARSEGCMVRLDRLSEVVAIDHERLTVTAQAGIRLRKLIADLEANGLALPVLGDVDTQTLAGAVSTATHGTGRVVGSLASLVESMRIVNASGEVLECGRGRDDIPVDIAAAGLGALGLISTLTVRCVPGFRLHSVREMASVDEVLEDLDAHVDGNDHFRFLWIPHTDRALVQCDNRTNQALAPRSLWGEVMNDLLIENLFFGTLCRVGRAYPSWVPRMMRAAVAAPSRTEFVDRSHRVFVAPRLVHFVEMEYAVPREETKPVLRALQGFVRSAGLRLTFPVEVRFSSADDVALSPAFGRESCYVAVHVYRGSPFRRCFRGFEEIAVARGGRPHWGKIHFLDKETLGVRYPRWEDFQQVRAKLDPGGRFANEYLDRVLGRVEPARPARMSRSR